MLICSVKSSLAKTNEISLIIMYLDCFIKICLMYLFSNLVKEGHNIDALVLYVLKLKLVSGQQHATHKGQTRNLCQKEVNLLITVLFFFHSKLTNTVNILK